MTSLGSLPREVQQSLQNLRVVEFGPNSAGWLARDDAEASNKALYIPDGEITDATGRRLVVDRVSKNNAQLLVLDGHWRRYLWSFREFAHSRFVILRIGIDLDTIFGLAGIVKHLLFDRVRARGIFTLERPSHAKARFLCVEVEDRRLPTNARRYLSPKIGISTFFDELDRKSIDYVVLRWFEDFPALDPTGDVDILVADDDIPLVESIFDDAAGVIPFDLYSVSGLPGTAFQDTAYYPTELSGQILDNRVRHPGGCWRPSQHDYFLSFAYHLVYHKGLDSGLAAAPDDKVSPDEHSKVASEKEQTYRRELAHAAAKAGCEQPLESLEEVDAVLESAGWAPPRDTIEHLSVRNPWLTSKLHKCANERLHQRLCAFVVRRRALDEGRLEFIESCLQRIGFEVVATEVLSDKTAARVAGYLRGGNWSQGKFARNGGKPGAVIAAYDLQPKRPSAADRSGHPTLANARIGEKRRIRALINQQLPDHKRYNAIHSTDNGTQALHYLEHLVPNRLAQILRDIDALERQFETREPVVRKLSVNGVNAKVELIEFGDTLAVKKQFRPSCKRYWRRERDAYQRFHHQRPEFPRLLDSGENYIVLPHIDDHLQGWLDSAKLMPVPVARRAMEVLRFFHDRGLTMIDSHPGNFLWNPKDGLTVVDLEYLQPYETTPSDFSHGYDIAGLPAQFTGDAPWSYGPHNTGYDFRWKTEVGLPFEELAQYPSLSTCTKRLGAAAAYRLRHARRSLPISQATLGSATRHLDHLVERLILKADVPE